ncbi:hypothetical protein ACSAZL_04990 [Methanosarcina sp. T3]|uniref:hypothetical protein n=1 Tax=Methanosarcina sp. T3 TaxID=3439062 RepID=UPI003F8472B4
MGGIIGGMFTFLGVKLSLDNQKYSDKRESESHRKRLLTQLQISSEMFSELDNVNENEGIDCRFIVYDKDWYTHLAYLENLSAEEFRIITGWFRNLQDLEISSKSNISGQVLIKMVKEYREDLERIKEIIKKLEIN